MQVRRWGAIVVVGLLAAAGPAEAQAPVAAGGQACGKPEFEAVVESAAASLRDLNSRNTPGFQDKLRLLRERQKWSADEFMAKASTYVQDDRIAAYDQRASDLLDKVNTMGEAGAAAKSPDCRLLGDLRATMTALIDTQIEKWAYMFTKIERGLVN